MENNYNKKKQFIVNTIYVLLIVIMVYLFLKYAFSLASPFIFAFFIAYLLNKPAERISQSTKLPHKLVSFFLVLIFYGTVGILVSFIGIRFVSRVAKIISLIPSIYDKQLVPFLITTFDRIEDTIYNIDPAIVGIISEGFNQFVRSLGEHITNFSLALLGSLSNIASSLPGFFIRVLLMIISTFFIAIDFEALSSFVKRQFSQKGNEIIDNIREYMVNTLFVVIRSYGLIMLITFIELSIGLSIIGIPNAVLIGFLIAIFDILPVLGTGGIMIPWTIMTFIQRDFKTGIGLLLLYIFVTVMRNILEPKIVGGQLGLHPVITLMSMFVGAKLLGVVGLFGFPIILSLLRHLNHTGVIKIFK
ncbi:MAG: sporulation integral membrane protein YtvI [Tissierellia bacterium]|nr:sporulation integral membrane protein YtvI [Tissierellia bacterium]